MPRGSKKSYTSKQKRQAEHIEDSAKSRGRSSKTAARIAWATVNKQDGGGKQKTARKKAATKKKTARKKTATKRATKKSTRTRR